LTACAPAAPPPPDTAADVTAINTLRSNFETAMKSNNPDNVVALYTEDAVVMPENEPAVKGKDAIAAYYKKMMDTYTVNATITAEETQVAGDWAFDRGQFVFAVTPKAAPDPKAKPAPGTMMPMAMTEQGKYLVVLQRQADKSWKVAREIGNPNTPMMPMTH
jgi:uncharacterized protein (TIGR02246 family)